MRMAELHAEAENIRAVIGGNNPPEPTPIDRAQDAMVALSSFLNETPVITEGEHLVEAKRLVEHARGAAAEIEDERLSFTKPLNDQLTSINATYKAIHNTDAKKPGTLDKVLNELKARLTAYGKAEEAKREREAELARIALAEAEAAAREAERIEQEAKQEAVTGVIDTGVAEKIAAADTAFADFERASRFAKQTEAQTIFRIGNGQGKALGMRTEKTLVLESYGKAIKAIGPNDTIKEAILTAARAYRKLHGCLPEGVSETQERKF